MASEKLTGAFITIHKVVNPGGAEVETLIGFTKDDVEISYDTNSAELVLHNQEIKLTKPLSYGQEVSFGGVVTTEQQSLKDLGIADGAAPEVLRGFSKVNLQAVRIKVYENNGDVTVKHKVLFLDCVVMCDKITYAQEDFATWECKLGVNGQIKRENSP